MDNLKCLKRRSFPPESVKAQRMLRRRRSPHRVSRIISFNILVAVKADEGTLFLFREYMDALKKHRTVPKVLRDQLLLALHFKHGYGERDLKLMFHVSVQTVKRLLSVRHIVST